MKSKNINDSTNFDKSVNDKLAVPELVREATVAHDDSKSKEKIKTSFAQIIVRKIKEKPYFEILYFDSQDKCFHIGFGSFYLEYVFQWLADEFEIIEGISETDYGRFQFVEETDHTEKGETMDAREKLIDILKQAPFEGKVLDEWWLEEKIKMIADHLIANGVTVQKWISAKDSPPDNKEYDWVLAQVVEDNGFMHIPKVMEYRQQRNDWFEESYGWLSEHNGLFTVTHWMPLPESPKDVKNDE